MDHTNFLDRLSDKFLVGDGCWEWTAVRNSDGYGMVRLDGRMQNAHRVLYELMVGPIPEGLELDHLCRNRACVRPDHLDAVTTRENILRGQGLAAACAAKTHCPRGHRYDYVRPDGRRTCRICQRAHGRAYRLRQKVAS